MNLSKHIHALTHTQREEERRSLIFTSFCILHTINLFKILLETLTSDFHILNFASAGHFDDSFNLFLSFIEFVSLTKTFPLDTPKLTELFSKQKCAYDLIFPLIENCFKLFFAFCRVKTDCINFVSWFFFWSSKTRMHSIIKFDALFFCIFRLTNK